MGQLSLISIDWNFFPPIKLLINVDVWSLCFHRSSHLCSFSLSPFLPPDCVFFFFCSDNFLLRKQFVSED